MIVQQASEEGVNVLDFSPWPSPNSSVFVRKASARREQERRERTVNRPARPTRSGSHHVGAARQSPARASGQPLATRDQLVAAGAIIPAADAAALPADPIA